MNLAVTFSAFLREADAFLKFALFADVEALNRTVVAHYAGPDLALLALRILELNLFILFSHFSSPVDRDESIPPQTAAVNDRRSDKDASSHKVPAIISGEPGNAN